MWPPDKPLTARQRQLLILRCNGLDHGAIASKLYISVRTVECHMQRIAQKAGTGNQVQLGMWAAANLHELSDYLPRKVGA